MGVGGLVTAAKSETLDDGHVKMLCWRLHELLRAGYAFGDALTLTMHPGVDLHLAIELPRRGCPHATALRILL